MRASMTVGEGRGRCRSLACIWGDPNGILGALALTAMAHREDRLQALKAGFQAHVAKPVKLAELVITLASIGQWHRMEQS